MDRDTGFQDVFRPVSGKGRFEERVIFLCPELERDIPGDLVHAGTVEGNLTVRTQGVRRERVAGKRQRAGIMVELGHGGRRGRCSRRRLFYVPEPVFCAGCDGVHGNVL